MKRCGTGILSSFAEQISPTGKALPEGQEYPIAMADTPHFAAVAGDAALAALLESDAR
jgi:hypothetical protein